MSGTREQFEAACRANGIALAYAFGSAAPTLAAAVLGGSQPPRLAPPADLDLGLVLLPPLGSRAEPVSMLYARLSSELSDALPGLPLDLVLLEETNSIFRVAAISGICVFAADEDFRLDFELDALRRAADFRYHFDQYHRERREGLTQ